jgi:ketosteroid isomerase-like protein
MPTEPADVIRAVTVGFSRLVAGGLTPSEPEAQLDQLAELYAERTNMRHPFAPLGDRPLRSRAELREHFARAAPEPAVAERFDPVDTIVHTTEDPEVVVVEFSYAIAAGDRKSAVPRIFVVRVRDGQIVESRDYADHVGGPKPWRPAGARCTRRHRISAPRSSTCSPRVTVPWSGPACTIRRSSG